MPSKANSARSALLIVSLGVTVDGPQLASAAPQPCQRLIEALREQPRSSRPVSLRDARGFARSDDHAACAQWLGQLPPLPASSDALPESTSVRQIRVGELIGRPVVDRTGLPVGHVNQIVSWSGAIFIVATDRRPPGGSIHYRLALERLVARGGRLVVANASLRRIRQTAETSLHDTGRGLPKRARVRIAVAASEEDRDGSESYVKLPTTSGLRSSAASQEARARRQSAIELQAEVARNSADREAPQRIDGVRSSHPEFERISVERLRNLMLYDGALDAIAEIEHVVRDHTGTVAFVVGMGVSSGFRQKHVLVRMAEVRWRSERLVADGMTREALAKRPHWEAADGMIELSPPSHVDVPSS